jgi:hypothetical protein
MMMAAKELSDAGAEVVVVVATDRQAKSLWDKNREWLVESNVVVTTEREANRQVDWMSMRMKNSVPSRTLLVDHYVLERRYHFLLEMLHRFDEVTP